MIGYWIAIAAGGLLVGSTALPMVRRAVPGASVPRWSWRTTATAVAAALVGGLVGLPLFGRAGGWVIAVCAAGGVVWREVAPDLRPVLRPELSYDVADE